MNSSDPTMQTWEAAWLAADGDQLQQLYTDDAMVFAPSQQMIKGPAAIHGFFGGGMGTIAVRFSRETLTRATTLAFETGVVRDLALETEAVLEVCDYVITWERVGDQWKIKFHSWAVRST